MTSRPHKMRALPSCGVTSSLAAKMEYDMELVVYKKCDDLSLGEKVLRISIGGFPDKAYITYRGDLGEIQSLLQDVTQAFTQLTEEAPISPDDGKQFA